ncbi:MAG TPA: CpaD family pilus assembly lipoprotein [Sphingomonadaceae bacterium]|nr:CpaD family pilus assembly lipoprotein [Sphingomonadaceae bacterium]
MAPKVLLALIAVSTTITACGPVNRGLESVNQPVVSRADYIFDVAAPEYGGLSDAEGARLDAWFRSMQLSYGDTIYIDDPQGAGDPARRGAVAAVAGRYGLLVSPGAPATAGSIPAGAIRIVVSRPAAYVPDCPNWDRPSQPEFAASTSSNFGCATNGNLAAIIANPEDLLRGRAAGTTDAATAAKAVAGYRTSTPTGAGALKIESTKGN